MKLELSFPFSSQVKPVASKYLNTFYKNILSLLSVPPGDFSELFTFLNVLCATWAEGSSGLYDVNPQVGFFNLPPESLVSTLPTFVPQSPCSWVKLFGPTA